MNNSLHTEIVGIKLRTPLMAASGTFGFGEEYLDFLEQADIGAIVVKGMTREPRPGNGGRRMAETPAGMLNCIGLQNPGLEHFREVDLPELRKIYLGPIVANISGFSVDEYREVAAQVDREEQVEILEINISCPNVDHGGSAFGSNPKLSEEITRAVRDVTKKPIFMKLTPNVLDITEIAKACESGGADG